MANRKFTGGCSWRAISCPLLRQIQTEVKQGMVVASDIAHELTDLAVVHLAMVAAPLALHTHRMRATLGKAARIEGDDPIGFTQPLACLSDQHRHQWAMVPWDDTDEVLDDLPFDVDQRRDFLGILAWQMGPQALEVEMQGVGGHGLKCLLVGHDELGETIHHLMEEIG